MAKANDPLAILRPYAVENPVSPSALKLPGVLAPAAPRPRPVPQMNGVTVDEVQRDRKLSADEENERKWLMAQYSDALLNGKDDSARWYGEQLRDYGVTGLDTPQGMASFHKSLISSPATLQGSGVAESRGLTLPTDPAQRANQVQYLQNEANSAEAAGNHGRALRIRTFLQRNGFGPQESGQAAYAQDTKAQQAAATHQPLIGRLAGSLLRMSVPALLDEESNPDKPTPYADRLTTPAARADYEAEATAATYGQRKNLPAEGVLGKTAARFGIFPQSNADEVAAALEADAANIAKQTGDYTDPRSVALRNKGLAVLDAAYANHAAVSPDSQHPVRDSLTNTAYGVAAGLENTLVRDPYNTIQYLATAGHGQNIPRASEGTAGGQFVGETAGMLVPIGGADALAAKGVGKLLPVALREAPLGKALIHAGGAVGANAYMQANSAAQQGLPLEQLGYNLAVSTPFAAAAGGTRNLLPLAPTAPLNAARTGANIAREAGLWAGANYAADTNPDASYLEHVGQMLGPSIMFGAKGEPVRRPVPEPTPAPINSLRPVSLERGGTYRGEYAGKAADAPVVPGETQAPAETPNAPTYAAGDRVTLTGGRTGVIVDPREGTPTVRVQIDGKPAPAMVKNEAIVGKVEDAPAVAEQPPTAPQTPAQAQAEAGTGKGITGRTDTVSTEAGTTVASRYTVREAGDIRASHDTQFAPNPDHPEGWQGRGRDDANQQQQVRAMAANLNPRRLADGAGMSNAGSPIVDAQGRVMAGNGRAIALQMVYEQGSPRAAAYRQWLIDNAESFGLDRDAIAKMQNPVLLREVSFDTPDAAVQFAKESDQTSTMKMGNAERSVVNAKLMTPDVMNLFAPNDEGNINTADNAAFRSAFVGKLPESERNPLVQADGSLSEEGVREIKGALFHAAYQDKALTEYFRETPDPVAKNVYNALLAVAPRVAADRVAMESGKLVSADLDGDLSAAVRTFVDLKQRGKPISDYLSQVTMPGMEEGSLSPLSRELLSFFDKYGRSAAKIREFMSTYQQSIEARGNPQQGGLFGGEPAKVDRVQVVRDLVQTLEQKWQRGTTDADLFSGERVGVGRPGFGSKNTITTDAHLQEALAVLNGKSRGMAGELPAGEGASEQAVKRVKALATIAAYYIEAGYRNFAQWVKDVREKYGIEATDEEYQQAWDAGHADLKEKAGIEFTPQHEGEKVNTWQKTVANAPMTPPELARQIAENAVSYRPISNKETLNGAREILDADTTGGTETWSRVMSRADLSAKDVAIGEELIRRAIQQGDHARANRITIDLAQKLTDAGRAVQAASIIKRLSPEGMLLYAQRYVDKHGGLTDGLPEEIARQVVETMTLREALNAKQTEGADAYRQALESGLKKSGMFDEKQQAYLLRNFDRFVARDKTAPLEALNRFASRADEILLAKTLKTISDQVPSTGGDKARGLQRILMLANFRTHLRNMLGNVPMFVLENTSDAVRVGFDGLVSVFTKQRTATLPRFTEQGRGITQGIQQAIEDYRLGVNTQAGAGSPEGASRYEIPRGRTFNSKALDTIDGFVSLGLSIGDRPFFQAAYNEGLRQYMTVHKLTEETPEAKEYAMQLAMYRTYQDVNAITKAALGIRKALNGDKDFGFGSLLMPFAKTPANLTARALDYSVVVPLARAINDVRSGVKGEFNQLNFVTNLSRSVTGAGLIWAGYLLASAGLATGKDDRKPRAAAFKRAVGLQPYAFQIDGGTYTFDWAQPSSFLLAIGVDLYGSEKSKDAAANKLKTAFVSGGDTLFSLGVFSSLRKAMKGESPTENFMSAGLGTLSQLNPTIVGQVAHVVDPTVRNVNYDNALYGINEQLVSRIPGLSKSLPAKVGTTGEVLRYEGGAIGQLVSPGIWRKLNVTPVGREMLRLYDSTGEATVFPRQVERTLRYKGVDIPLTPAEQSAMQRTVGKYSMQFLTQAVNNAAYRQMPDDMRAQFLQRVNDEVFEFAKMQVLVRKARSSTK